MRRIVSVGALFFVLSCSDKLAPAAQPAKPAEPAPAPQPAPTVAAPAAPPEPNPCDTRGPITLGLEAGTSKETPWGLEVRYVVDEDKKLGSGYIFQLRSEGRRWETRRDNRNWNQPLTWRGYCWRGAERPARRALHLKIDIAPVCKGGKLQELGGCGDAFGPS